MLLGDLQLNILKNFIKYAERHFSVEKFVFYTISVKVASKAIKKPKIENFYPLSAISDPLQIGLSQKGSVKYFDLYHFIIMGYNDYYFR